MQATRAWRDGREGERQVREWLMERGFYVVPMADINSYRNRAPSLEATSESVTLPDLQVYSHGIQRWVEIKTKNQATWHRQTKRWEHGLPLKNWEAYLKCQDVSGVECWLCVLEEVPIPLVLLAPINRLQLSRRIYLGANMPGGRPHIYFARDAFDVYPGPSDRIEMPDPRSPRTLHDGMPNPQISLFNDGWQEQGKAR